MKVNPAPKKMNLTILGLGQIGTSFGLALAEHTNLLQRTGFDIDISAGNHAKKLGALDLVKGNMPSAVKGADGVILALPFDQVREAFEIIAPELKPGCVVMETSPVKDAVIAWAKELLPAGCHYVGLIPVLNRDALQVPEVGILAARADLFRGGMMWIAAPPDTASGAINLAADLIRLVGAEHLFADPLEVDGLMALTHLLPQLLAAALLNITTEQPGWHDAGRLAGRSFAESAHPIVLNDPQALAAAVFANPQNIERGLNSLIASLQTLRSDIREQNPAALTKRLALAQQGYQTWWQQRAHNGPDVPTTDAPSPSDFFKRLVGGQRGK